MLLKLSETWTKLTAFTKSRWKGFGYLLSMASFAYIVVLLVYGWIQLQNIDWGSYILPIMGALLIHLLSSIIQFFVWTRLLMEHHNAGWEDIAIYSRVLMLRRLPGGIWHWIGRATMYAESSQVPAKTTGVANFMEWALLILTAAIFAAGKAEILPILVRLSLMLLFLGLAIGMSFSWQSVASSRVKRLAESLLWIFTYGIAWGLGGLVMYWFGYTTSLQFNSINALDLASATWIWATAAGGSMILVFIPLGLGIREISLTWLLQFYVPPVGALAIALLIRFTFTLGDFLWGVMGWNLSSYFLRRRKFK
jgi:hypothetical protein